MVSSEGCVSLVDYCQVHDHIIRVVSCHLGALSGLLLHRIPSLVAQGIPIDLSCRLFSGPLMALNMLQEVTNGTHKVFLSRVTVWCGFR